MEVWLGCFFTPQWQCAWLYVYWPTSHFAAEQIATADSNSNVVQTFNLRIADTHLYIVYLQNKVILGVSSVPWPDL